jgi:hypothetical protein
MLLEVITVVFVNISDVLDMTSCILYKCTKISEKPDTPSSRHKVVQ